MTPSPYTSGRTYANQLYLSRGDLDATCPFGDEARSAGLRDRMDELRECRVWDRDLIDAAAMGLGINYGAIIAQDHTP